MEDSRENCLPEILDEERKVGGIGMEVCFVGEKVSFLRLKTQGYRKTRGNGNVLTHFICPLNIKPIN
jgi:hypothetical protein